MKLNFSFLLFLSFSFLLSLGQVSYKTMMDDPSYNYYNVIEVAEAHFANRDKGKGSGYIGYMRWKHFNEARFFPSGDRAGVSFTNAEVAYESLKTHPTFAKKAFENGWEDLGPYDAENITSHYSAGIGRVETFFVDPNNTNVMYMGSRSGGFWRTFNGGQTWENTTDTLVASGVNTIAVDPYSNQNVLINVRNANNGTTHGIYKSENGGGSWTETRFNPVVWGGGGLGKNNQIYFVSFHPTVPDLIFIGTSDGLYRSEDHLATWTKEFSGSPREIRYHPTKKEVIYVYDYTSSNRNYIMKSTDEGNTFSRGGFVSGNAGARGRLSVTRTNDRSIYFASTNGVWKSLDEGNTFTFIVNPNTNCDGFAVSDTDSTEMLYGAIDAFGSSNGGVSFSKRTHWARPFQASYIHADIRTLECQNGVFYVGTDGYFCKSDDNGVTWTKLNNGTGIREFYRSGISQSNADIAMSGSQDNGTSIVKKDGWIEWNGGDGMDAVVHPLNPDWMIGSWQWGSRNRTIDGGLTRQATDNPEKGSGQADWIAPLLLNPNDHMIAMHFARNIFNGDDFGTNWNAVENPNIGLIDVAAISDETDQVFAFSRNNIGRLTEDGGLTYQNITNTQTGASITDMCFAPKNDSILIITHGNYQSDNRKVFLSFDRGRTWENITFNLGNMPIRSVVIDHQNPPNIYVGAEIGIYTMPLYGNQWQTFGENLPNVAVLDLDIQFGSNRLKATTWGRGMWENALLNRQDFPSFQEVTITNPPTLSTPKFGVAQTIECDIEYGEDIQKVYATYSVEGVGLEEVLAFKNDSGRWKSTEPLPLSEVGQKVYFKVYAVGARQDTTETYRYMYEVRPAVYCETQGTFFSNNYISSVALGNYVNLSVQEVYGNFTRDTIELFTDSTYSFSTGLNYHAELDTVRAFVDFNQDLEFDSTELIQLSVLDEGHFTFGELVVPEMPHLSNTRLRVISSLHDQLDACGDFSGEVEDYTLKFISQKAIDKQELESKFSIFPNPSAGDVIVRLGEEKELVSIKVVNLLGQMVINKDYHQTSSVVLPRLNHGVYLISVGYGETVIVQKVIVE